MYFSYSFFFFTGVEDVVTETGIEENIGLVTFGGRAHVVQNLTNDLSRIREAVGKFILASVNLSVILPTASENLAICNFTMKNWYRREINVLSQL